MFPLAVEHSPGFDSTIRQLVNQLDELEMVTTFKGTTLSQKISGAFLEGDCIRFHSIHQIGCITPGQKIVIRYDTLPQTITATISDVDMTAGVIMIDQVKMINHCFKPREHPRVQPDKPVRVVLVIVDQSFSTCLSDISGTGVHVIRYQLHDKEIAIRPGLNVKMNFTLPEDNQPISIPGIIHRFERMGESAMASLYVQFAPIEKHLVLVRKYIIARQAQIQEEMSNAITMALEPIQTKDLYF